MTRGFLRFTRESLVRLLRRRVLSWAVGCLCRLYYARGLMMGRRLHACS